MHNIDASPKINTHFKDDFVLNEKENRRNKRNIKKKLFRMNKEKEEGLRRNV